MDREMLRANLLVSNFVEVRDPEGEPWVVWVARPEDPTHYPGVISAWRFIKLAARRLSRMVRRDDHWNVEAGRSTHSDDRRGARAVATAPSHEDALAKALAIATSIQSTGLPPPD